MIVVGERTAACPVCTRGRIFTAERRNGVEIEHVRPCLACGGTGRIRQAEHVSEEVPS